MNTTDKSMTLQEIADLMRTTPRTIRRWIENQRSDTLTERSDTLTDVRAKIDTARTTKKSATFTLEETLYIIRLGGNDTLADLLAANATQANTANLPTVKVSNLAEIIAEAMTRTMTPMLEKLTETLDRVNRLQQLLPAPELSDRDRLRRHVNQYCHETGLDHHSAWLRLYDRHYYRCKTNLRHRAEKEGIKTLDLAEREDRIRELYQVALAELPVERRD